MKKNLLILVMCFCLILVGCNKQEKYEKAMKEYATTFYNLHKKGQENQESLKVSISDLKEAIEIQA